MNLPEPPPLSDEVQRELCRAAAEVRDVEPWKFLGDTELLGIEDPESGAIGLVSILGMGGEMFAFHWHHGEGSRCFWNALIKGREPVDPEAMLRQVEMVECEFAGASEADPVDRERWRTFGPDGRKRKSVPVVRSYRPGFCPWYPEEDEVRALVRAMDLFLEFLPRLAEWWKRAPGEGGSAKRPVIPVLRRAARGTDGWALDTGRLPEPAAEVAPEEPAEDGFTFRLAALPRIGEVWEIGSMWLSRAVAEGDRPYFPKLALGVSLESETLADPVLYGGPGEEGIPGDQRALREVFERLAKARGGIPEVVRVASDTAETAFLSLARASGMKVSRDRLEVFPGVQAMFAEMEERMPG
jgi:hypothetical protein